MQVGVYMGRRCQVRPCNAVQGETCRMIASLRELVNSCAMMGCWPHSSPKMVANDHTMFTSAWGKRGNGGARVLALRTRW